MANPTPDFDAVVIGAGFSGIHMLKSLRDKLGLKVRVYEAGTTVGGTWYWNRYPGARCDSDAYIYCFTWDKQLLQEWQWSERYPEQPEILRQYQERFKYILVDEYQDTNVAQYLWLRLLGQSTAAAQPGTSLAAREVPRARRTSPAGRAPPRCAAADCTWRCGRNAPRTRF